MADKTIEWLHGVRAQDAHKPFFAYFSTGCSHAPHHVAEAVGRQVQGQVRPGLGPAARGDLRPAEGARRHPRRTRSSPPRDEAFPAWDDVPDKLKAFYARQMEVYAGYSENADHNVGRVIDAIDELGELDNTLIIWIWGDNGASMEGTITGSFNELTMQNGIPLTDEMQLQLAERYGGIEAWGDQIMDPHYSAAWAWAGQHPVPVGQAGRLAPRRHPQPDGRPLARADHRRAAALRSQFTHVIDVGADDPRHRRHPGADARSTGSSRSRCTASTFADSLTDAGRARAPHPAVLRDDRQPGDVQGRLVAGDEDRAHPVGAHARGARARTRPGVWDPDADPAELYYLPDDFTQAHDLAAEHPEKVAGAQGAVLGRRPRSTRCCRCWPRCRRSSASLPPLPEATTFEFRGDVQNVMSGHDPADLQPLLRDQRRPRRSPTAAPKGVIVAEADHLGGFSLFVDDGKLTHTYSMMGVFVYRQQAEEAAARPAR